MNKQERIKQLEKELEELRQEREFKPGDYFAFDHSVGRVWLGRVGDYYDLMEGERWHYNDAFIKGRCRVPEPEEIKTALVKEAERRGFPTKEWQHPLRPNSTFENTRLVNDWTYEPDIDRLCNMEGLVYEQGKWAEIITEPEIVVNGYEATFCDGYVQFGCAEIPNYLFKELNGIANSKYMQGNRTLQAIKIGDGLFTIDQIKQIAERIKRR